LIEKHETKNFEFVFFDFVGLCAGSTAEGGLFVFSVFPKLRVWKTLSRPDSVSASCIPYLSWREVNNLGTDTNDPILCVGWGAQILLFRMTAKTSGEVVVVEMGNFSLNAEVVSITWLGYNAITVLTTANEMKVLDPFSLVVLETSSVEVRKKQKKTTYCFFLFVLKIEYGIMWSYSSWF
jgi:hypothetical protein